MELMETVAKVKSDEDEVAVHLITAEDDFRNEQQKEQLQKVTDACAGAGIRFTWEFDQPGSIHARHIVTDNGWKILLDRGLDVFQRYEMNDAFDLSNRLQQYRQCKAFEVTFLRFQS
jgi:ATP-dependent Lon protease